MTVDDEAIERFVEAAKGGDPEAFGALFDHFYAPVYRYVAARVGRPSDAEDLAQLVFVKALEALPRYELRGVPFGGWLFRLARNVVIDHVRTRRDHVTLDVIVQRSTDDLRTQSGCLGKLNGGLTLGRTGDHADLVGSILFDG